MILTIIMKSHKIFLTAAQSTELDTSESWINNESWKVGKIIENKDHRNIEYVFSHVLKNSVVVNMHS